MMSELRINAAAVTPRGGEHCYFAQNGVSISSGQNRPVESVDIRADGGHVLAPPSHVVDPEKGIDGLYIWRPTLELPHRGELSPVPKWIEDVAAKPKPKADPVIELMTSSNNVDLKTVAQAIEIIDGLTSKYCDNRED